MTSCHEDTARLSLTGIVLGQAVIVVLGVLAGLAIQATRDLGRLPIGPWAGLGVLAAYAGAAIVLGGVLFRMRDA